MKWLIVICILLFGGIASPNFLMAQRTLFLVDNTGNPIKATASIFINGEFAGQSNADGSFNLPELASGKDLCVRHLNFRDTCFSWVKGLDKMNIKLQPKSYTLQELKVKSKRRNRQKMLGCYTCKEQGEFYGIPGTQMGLEIPNTIKKRGKIKSLDLFLSGLGNPGTPFKIRLYTRIPEQDSLIPMEIELPEVSFETKGNEWVGLELDSFLIPFPEEGVVVAMEWLAISEAYPHSHRYRIEGQAAQIDYYGQVLGGSSFLRGEHALKIYSNNTFHRIRKEEWGKTYYNPMIRVEISYY